MNNVTTKTKRGIYFFLIITMLNLVYAGTCPSGVGVCNPSIPFQSTISGGTTANNNTFYSNASVFWGTYNFNDYNMPFILNVANQNASLWAEASNKYNASYVPYVGATGNVDLNGKVITNVSYSNASIMNARKYRINNGATLGTILRGNGSDYIATTATYPTTTTASQILYSTATNAIGGSSRFRFNGTTHIVNGTTELLGEQNGKILGVSLNTKTFTATTGKAIDYNILRNYTNSASAGGSFTGQSIIYNENVTIPQFDFTQLVHTITGNYFEVNYNLINNQFGTASNPTVYAQDAIINIRRTLRDTSGTSSGNFYGQRFILNDYSNSTGNTYNSPQSSIFTGVNPVVSLSATRSRTSTTISQTVYGDRVTINELAVNNATTLDMYGFYADVTGKSGSIGTANGIWINYISGATMRGLVLDQDGAGGDVVFGELQKARIYYNATDLIINPKEVGTGKLFVLGDLVSDNLVTNNITAVSINSTGNINTQSNFSVNNVQGLTGNYTILKDADLVGLTKTFCDLNFTGGILASSSC